MRSFLTVIFLCFPLLTGCSTVASRVAKAVLGGGGPSLEAQIGKENTKQIVGNQSTVSAGRDQTNTTQKVSAERVERVVINETPPWVVPSLVVFAVLGWMLPSPGEISRWFRNLFRRNK